MGESIQGNQVLAKRRRHWVRFSLRTLLVLVTVLCIWLGFKVNSARRQRDAVAAILRLGGAVAYDYQRAAGGKPNEFDPGNRPPGPEWLRNLVGPDYFQDVVRVDLTNRPVTDDDLNLLADLPDVETLGLSKTNITNAGMAHIAKLRNLKQLSLWNTHIDDDGLKSLKNLRQMWSLILDGTQITNAGLEQIENLTNLKEWLGLSQTNISDAGLQHLRRMSKLKRLNLIGTQVTKNGAVELQPLLAPNAEISLQP